MKKLLIIVIVVILFIAIVSVVSTRLPGSHTYYATSRLELTSSNGLYELMLYEKIMRATSNFLTSASTHGALAKLSDSADTGFQLSSVGPVKGTRLIYVQFSGVESNAVFCVASNARIMLTAFYATNWPTVRVGYTDTSDPGARPFLQSVVDELDYWIYRVRN